MATEEETSVCELVRKHLKEFPLYGEHQSVIAKRHERGLSISYLSKKPFPSLTRTTHFLLQIEDDICYIVSFAIEENYRMQKFGTKLYQAVKAFCKEYGCKRIRGTPSGYGVDFCPKVDDFKEINNTEIEVVLE